MKGGINCRALPLLTSSEQNCGEKKHLMEFIEKIWTSEEDAGLYNSGAGVFHFMSRSLYFSGLRGWSTTVHFFICLNFRLEMPTGSFSFLNVILICYKCATLQKIETRHIRKGG